MKLKPAQWEQITGIEVIDRDGWKDGEDWNREVSLDVFIIKCNKSTTNAPSKNIVAANIHKFADYMINALDIHY